MTNDPQNTIELDDTTVFDTRSLQFRNRQTGRFMGLEKGITRLKVDGGVVFLLDEPEPELPKGDAEWGEFK